MEFEFSDLNKADLTNFREFTFQLVKGVPPGKRLAEWMLESWTADDSKNLLAKVPFLKGRGICYTNVRKFAKAPGKAPALVSTGHVSHLLFSSSVQGRVFLVVPWDEDVKAILSEAFENGLESQHMLPGMQVMPSTGATGTNQFLVPAGALINSGYFTATGLLALAVARSEELAVPSIVTESLATIQLRLTSAMTSEARFLDQLSAGLRYGPQRPANADKSSLQNFPKSSGYWLLGTGGPRAPGNPYLYPYLLSPLSLFLSLSLSPSLSLFPHLSLSLFLFRTSLSICLSISFSLSLSLSLSISLSLSLYLYLSLGICLFSLSLSLFLSLSISISPFRSSPLLFSLSLSLYISLSLFLSLDLSLSLSLVLIKVLRGRRGSSTASGIRSRWRKECRTLFSMTRLKNSLHNTTGST